MPETYNEHVSSTSGGKGEGVGPVTQTQLCAKRAMNTFPPKGGGESATMPNSARRVQSTRFHEAADQGTIFAARHTKMARARPKKARKLINAKATRDRAKLKYKLRLKLKLSHPTRETIHVVLKS